MSAAPPPRHREEEEGEEEDNNNNNKQKERLDNNDTTTTTATATATATATTSGAAAAAAAAAATDDAVDDTEDLPDDFVHIQKTLSCERRRRQSRQTRGIQDLVPFPFSPLIRPLTLSDLESCVALENAAFANPAHRCTREKFLYRLTECSELCMGLFCTVVPSKTEGWEIDTLRTAHPVETGRGDGAVSVLLAHIVATQSHDDVVTDNAMDYPDNYKAAKKNSSNSNTSSGNNNEMKPKIGHQSTGRTICIHSLAVHPKLQGVGLGRLIVFSYIQQVKHAGIADRVALICEEYLVNYYKRFGFTHVGPSAASFGGGGWHDMVFDFNYKPETA